MNVKQSPVGNSEMWLGLVKNFTPPQQVQDAISLKSMAIGEREREMEREKWALEQKISTWTLKQECGF